MRPAADRRQRGAVLIETALLLLLSFALLPYLLYAARLCWYRLVLERAVHDAARYVATVPLEVMRDPAQQAVVLAVAQDMVLDSAAAARLETRPSGIVVQCNSWPCAMMAFGSSIDSITVSTSLPFRDPYFGTAFIPVDDDLVLDFSARFHYGY
jgi:Flp pilus assembly protein TadG